MRTPITYYGGKQTMLPHILPLVPSHEIYTEAFCGGAALFFAKEPVRAEIINDLNLELVNFYNVVQCDYESLKELIDSTLHSRDGICQQARWELWLRPSWHTDKEAPQC